ncbi:substrate-binding domain-containing protein [Thioclava sp. FTW29]|uniref:Substrate-binding domain-containing protein n=1 Tax=Thioclava litoralis TaxID=3076557 RepID=A0ABZ1E4L8_9RHOB|nr:substrate-binding domain-containing protein [Thioclava sp. FTW29]
MGYIINRRNGLGMATALGLLGLLGGLLGGLPAQAQDTPAPDAQGKTVIASIVFMGDQFMTSMQSGIRDVAKAHGAEVLELNIDGDITKEAQAIDTYISRGVDAILIAPVSATNSAAALARAKAKGITIVALNGGLADPDLADATFATEDRELGTHTGEAAAAFIKDRMGGRAKIGILAFSSLLPEQSAARVGGFRDTVTKGTQIDILGTQDAWMPEKAVQVATDMLTAHPDINLLFAANEGGTVGAMQAVRNAGRMGKVYVFGIDGSEQLARGLMASDDVLQATTAQSGQAMGRAGAEAAFALMDATGQVAKMNKVPVVPLQRGQKDAIMRYVATLR